MKESELSPRALLLWVEWRSLAKRTAELNEIRRRQGRRQRLADKKRGTCKTKRVRKCSHRFFEGPEAGSAYGTYHTNV